MHCLLFAQLSVLAHTTQLRPANLRAVNLGSLIIGFNRKTAVCWRLWQRQQQCWLLSKACELGVAPTKLRLSGSVVSEVVAT